MDIRYTLVSTGAGDRTTQRERHSVTTGRVLLVFAAALVFVVARVLSIW
jgi:hypothetical protein